MLSEPAKPVNMSQVLIRRATDSDIYTIHRLYTQWVDEDITYGLVADDYDRIKAALGPYYLVAELDGEVIGFISGSTHISEGTAVIPKSEAYLEIDNLYIAPHFRRNKIGGMLIDQLLTTAKRNGICRALVYSATKDIHSVLKFYGTHGFKSWYVRMFNEL